MKKPFFRKTPFTFFVLSFWFLFSIVTLRAQTTYFWVGGTGTKTLNTLTNWNTTLGGGGSSPGSLSNANIFIVDGDNLGGGATGALTLEMNAAATLGQFIIRDNNQSVTLTGTSAYTCTVGGAIAGEDWTVSSGCSITLSTNANLTLASNGTLTSTVAGTVTVESGNTLTIPGTSGLLCTVTGSIINKGTLTSSVAARLIFESGSVYEHAQNGGNMLSSSIGSSRATINAGSTCKITGITSTNPTNFEGTYHHFVWDCPNQTTATGSTTGVLTINGNLTIGNNSSEITIGAFTTTINGTTIIGGTTGGTLAFSSIFGIKTFSGDVTIGSGATWDNSINEQINFTGDLIDLENNGTFTAGTGAYIFNGSFNTVKGTAGISLTTLQVVANGSLTNQITAGSGLSITGVGAVSFTIAGSFDQDVNAKLSLACSTFTSITGSFGASAAGNTVNFSSAGNQAIPSITYHHITSSGSGTKTYTSGGFIYGDVNVTGTSTLSFTTNATRIFGHTTVASSCTFITAVTIAFDGDLINQGTISTGSSILQFDGKNDTRIQTIRSGGSSFYEVHFRNTYNTPNSIVLDDDMTITNRLNLQGGRVSLGSSNLTLGASATLGTSIPSGGTMADIMVVTDGTGMFRKVWGTSNTSFTFPVGEGTGTAEYSPVTMTVTHGGAPTIGVRVVDAVHPSVAALSNISRYWVFSSSGGSLTNYRFTDGSSSGISYLQADVTGTEAAILPSGWNGSAWTPLTGGAVNTTTNILTSTASASPTLNGLEVTGRKEPSTYTWNTTNGSWQTAANWTPTRTTPAADDRLVISTTGTYTITNVPTETIARLTVNANVNVTLSPAVSGNTLTVSDGSASAADITVSGSGSLTVGAGLVLNMNTDPAVSGGLTNSGTLTVNGELRLGGTFTYTGNSPTWGGSSVLAYNPTLGTAGGTHSITSGNEAGNTPNELRILIPVNTTATTINYTLGANLSANILDLRYRTDGTVCASSCAGYANHTVNVILNDRTLTLNSDFRNYAYSSYRFRGSASSQMAINGSGVLTGVLYFEQTTPGTTNSLAQFTLNRTGSGSALLGNALDLSSTLILTAGTFDIGSQALTLRVSSIMRNAGSIDADAGTVVFANTIPLFLPASVFAGNVNNFTMSGSGGVTLGSNTGVMGTLALSSGTLDLSTYTLTYGGSSVTRTSGSMDADAGTVQFTNTSGLTLPASVFTGGNINNLTMNGVGGVILGSSLTLTGTLALDAGTLDIGSNTFTMNGTSLTRLSGGVDADAGTFVLNNMMPLTLPANVFTGNVNNLTVNTSGGVTHGSAVTVTGTLDLINGTYSLGNFDLTLGTASLTGGTASAFVKTTGTGRMRRTVTNADALFPVGRNSYNPLTVNNRTGTPDIFSLRVADAVYLNGQSGTEISTARVNSTWFIDKGTPNAAAGDGVNFTFQWNQAQELSGITQFNLNHHNGTGWVFPVSTGTPAVTGSSIKQLTFPGYKGTFSPFAIGGGTSPLPVKLTRFEGTCDKGSVELVWETESEINNEWFTVHRSADLKSWEEVLKMPGAGNSNAPLTYTATDERALEGINYYRLTQTDYDGASETFKPISVFCGYENSAADWMVYPNPSDGVFTVLFAGHDLPGETRLELTDLSGRVLKVLPVLPSIGKMEYTADISDMPPGVYLLRKLAKGFAMGTPLKIMLR